jgi:hypothetical protein
VPNFEHGFYGFAIAKTLIDEDFIFWFHAPDSYREREIKNPHFSEFSR